ncbi:unnamed protein product [Calypogeia fissa]
MRRRRRGKLRNNNLNPPSRPKAGDAAKTKKKRTPRKGEEEEDRTGGAQEEEEDRPTQQTFLTWIGLYIGAHASSKSRSIWRICIGPEPESAKIRAAGGGGGCGMLQPKQRVASFPVIVTIMSAQ